MNNISEKIEHLENIWINIRQIASESLFAVLNSNRTIENGGIEKFVAPQTSPQDVLSVLELDEKHFTWKKVLDIGWWFGGMAFVLEDFVNQYTICDPCRNSDLKDELLSKDFGYQQNLVDDTSRDICELHNRIDNFDFDKRFANEEYSALQKKLNRLMSVSSSRKKNLDYIKDWKIFDKIKHPKIIINPSKWEDIQWIENESQDTVIICHVLNKNYISPADVLSEASRILKIGWEILVVEDKGSEIEMVEKMLWIKWEIVWDKVIFRFTKK